MATIKKILSKYQLLAIEDFAVKETDKILARMKYLKEKFDTLDKSDTKAQLDVVVESQRLSGKLDGIRIVMEELERIAKIS